VTKKAFLLVGFSLILFLAANSMAVVPAFPGAEGWGANATGGRGGDVYHVTNLNDSGAGSLRNGITSATGARTIVFDVSGTIALTSVLSINKSNLTIAGQTAPGDGICIRDHRTEVSASNVIIRYIRSRLGDESLTEEDGIWIKKGSNIIMDHVTSSWSVDEVFSCSTDTNNPILTNVTVQWSIISEALNYSIHGKGAHGYGALIRGCYDERYSYHHNLWVHNSSRNPRPGNYDSQNSGRKNTYDVDPCGLLFDFRNNVIYNWGGSRPGYDADINSVCRYNYVGNWAKAGANSSNGYMYETLCPHFRAYYTGNYFNGAYATTDDWEWVSWKNKTSSPFAHTWTEAEKAVYKRAVPFDANGIATDTALIAYQRVLNHAGASLPKRDIVDTRIANNVSTLTGVIIDTQNQVGGWPVLHSTSAPLDTDQDGMPDAWETANGLDPNGAIDRNNYTLSTDYTNLEVYLNSLVPNGTYDTDVTPPTPDPMTWQDAPAVLNGTQIKMTATTATDPWGVEYYFTNITDSNHNSGWQDSTTYTDIGLLPSTTYYYKVKARDKSTNANQTDWSDEASATTLLYSCTSAIQGDINGDCQVNLQDLAVFAGEWLNPWPTTNLISNGTFATDITGWQFVSLAGASGTMTATYSATEGNSVGSAYLQKANGPPLTMKHRFYQVIPVTKGNRYHFSGDWKGSLIGTVGSITGARNWAEVYVGWAESASPDWGPVTVMYRKAIDSSSRQNIGTSGTWSWESMTDSRAGSWVPTDAIFTAAGDYMAIAFNLGATPSAGATWAWLDNIKVQECPLSDLNADCVVNMKDMAVMAANWLSCHRSPADQCWQ
jgi:pectate lyase